MTAVKWPEEPVRPAGSLPDAPLVVLIRITLPHKAIRNVVASCAHGHRLVRDGKQQWFISGVQRSNCSWDQIPDKLGFWSWDESRLGVEVYTLGVMEHLS